MKARPARQVTPSKTESPTHALKSEMRFAQLLSRRFGVWLFTGLTNRDQRRDAARRALQGAGNEIANQTQSWSAIFAKVYGEEL